ncbi:MAG: hypothetical protein ACLR43_02410 [Faecalibacillus faecis]
MLKNGPTITFQLLTTFTKYMITTGLRHFVLYAILDIPTTMVQENKKQELFIFTMMIWC